jgi:hypothetical protein
MSRIFEITCRIRKGSGSGNGSKKDPDPETDPKPTENFDPDPKKIISVHNTAFQACPEVGSEEVVITVTDSGDSDIVEVPYATYVILRSRIRQKYISEGGS